MMRPKSRVDRRLARFCERKLLQLGFGFGFGFEGGGGGGRSDPSFVWGMNASYADNITACCTVAPTVTRAGSSLTRINSSGVLEDVAANTWLRDYDPATLGLIGFVPWESRTNLLLRSEAFDNASWLKTRMTITADAAVAIDGATTADKLVEQTDVTTNRSAAETSISFTSGTTYTLSVFVKAAERSQINLRFGGAAFPAGNTVFDLSAVTVTNAGTVASSSITAYQNGWYRCVFSQVATVTTTDTASVFLASGGSITYSGVAGNGLFAWGAQLEAGADVSAYIRTTSAAVTRPATVATVATASIPGFSASTLTMTGRGFRYGGAVVGSTMAALSDGTANNRHRIGVTTANASSGATSTGGVAQSSLSSAAWATSPASGIAYRAALNDFALSFAGGAEVTDTSGTMPAITTLHIGHLVGPGNFWNQGITQLGLYNVAKTGLQNYSS